MSTPTYVAAALLLVSLVIVGLLAKARALGPLVSASYVLGAIGSASAYFLFA